MDWLLAVVGMAGVALAGQRRTRGYGWIVGMGVQVLWIGYALTTHQYGFILSALGFGAINTWNFITWYREHSKAAAAHEEAMARTRAIEIIEKERG